jgi:hypothetical protein
MVNFVLKSECDKFVTGEVMSIEAEAGMEECEKAGLYRSVPSGLLCLSI